MPRAIGQAYKIIGRTSCPACGTEIPAKETKGGKLSLCCTWCDFGVYINAGTKAHELMLAKVTLDAPAAAPIEASSSSSSSSSASSPAAEKPAPEKPARRSSFASPLFGGS